MEAVTAAVPCISVRGQSPMASTKSSSSVVSATTEITGNISGQGDLRIDGRVNGNISISGELLIAEDANVNGDISGTQVALEGQLTGSVDAAGPVHIGPRATYRGSIRGERLSIAPGASVAADLDTPFDLNLDI